MIEITAYGNDPCDSSKEPPIPGSCQTGRDATTPGTISSRACVLYGARWVLAPIRGVIHLVHGPVDCTYYSGTVRGKSHEVLSTDLREEDVIFGGSGKLKNAIRESLRLKPGSEAVLVYTTCTSGLIGEDVEKVCATAEETYGIPVIPVNCPGFSGASQKDGHDEAAKVIFDHFINRGKARPVKKSVNVLGEFDTGGDLGEIESMLGAFGITVTCAVSGKADVKNLRLAAGAELNLVHCRSTGGLLGKLMEEYHGIPKMKVSFYGIGETANSLRDIGRFFSIRDVEDYVSMRSKETLDAIKPYVRLLEGKRIAMYFGASRMASMARAFRELGMEVILAGSQYGSKDDYSEAGRKLDGKATLMNDAGVDELCAFLRDTRPDLMVGGTREKYIAHKLGVPFLVFPQQGAPYAGFRGFANLARHAASTVHAPVWKLNDRQGGIR